MARFWANTQKNTLMDNQEVKMEFYKRGIEFLYKQAPVIVICIVACLAMGGTVWTLWQKNELNYANLEKKFESTQDQLRMCDEKREQLALTVAELSVKLEFIQIKSRR